MSHRASDGYITNQTANGVDGYSTTIRAQNATGTNARGGDIVLGSGTGTLIDGYVKLLAGLAEQARAVPNKFYMVTGQRINLSTITTSPFNVPDGYFALMVDTSAARTINLPSNPLSGDVYKVKDSTGTAGTNSITVQGNGRNIDGGASHTISTNYGSVTVVYNEVSNTWMVIN